MILKAGTTVYWIRTDHPRFPKELREGDSNYGAYDCPTVAQEIAEAWNNYERKGPWYVRETVVLPKRTAGVPDGQASMPGFEER